jgi:uncharacterized protein (DUF983 family)
MSEDKKSVLPDKETLLQALHCKCPKCGEGDLYKGKVSVVVNDRCSVCNLNLEKNDSADGPAVFLMFFLGFLIVPLSLAVDRAFHLSMYTHFVLWTALALFITLGTLRPLKAYVIALQYKYRSGDWDED